MDEASATIAAPQERIWQLVTDITRMGEWSPEATGGRWRNGSGPAVGAEFVGTNRHGFMRWSTHCRVTECEPASRFTFTVRENHMAWGWVLEPDPATPGSTLVRHWREHLRPVTGPVKLLVRSGLLGRNREQLMVDGMRRTLEAVRATAERA